MWDRNGFPDIRNKFEPSAHNALWGPQRPVEVGFYGDASPEPTDARCCLEPWILMASPGQALIGQKPPQIQSVSKKKVSRILKKTGSPIFGFFGHNHMHSQMACETHPGSGIANSEWLHCGPPLWRACATVPCHANLAQKSGDLPIYCLGQGLPDVADFLAVL